MALSNESISDLLRRILGENCEETIKHFEKEELDIETGMNVVFLFYTVLNLPDLLW